MNKLMSYVQRQKYAHLPPPTHKSLRLSVNANVEFTCTGSCVKIGSGNVQNAFPSTGTNRSFAKLGDPVAVCWDDEINAATPPQGIRTPSLDVS